MTPDGVQLVPPYVGPEGVLTGSTRLSQEARERAQHSARAEEIGRLGRAIERSRERLEAQIEELRRAFAEEVENLARERDLREAEQNRARLDADEMAASRHVERRPGAPRGPQRTT